MAKEPSADLVDMINWYEEGGDRFESSNVAESAGTAQLLV